MALPPLGYYKWNWQEWRSSRRVQRMTYVDRGLYRELLDEQWKLGGLPMDMESLSDICGCPLSIMQDSWERIRFHFDEVDGLYVNATLEDQRTDLDKKRASLARNGLAGAEKKLANARIEEANSSNGQQLSATASNCHIEEKRREEKSKDSSAEASSTPDNGKLICSLPCLKDQIFNVWESKLKEWQDAYPAIDVKQQLREMKAWLVANPSNKKTLKGVQRFVVSWLGREQDKAPRIAHAPIVADSGRESDASRMIRLQQEALQQVERERNAIN